MKLMTLKQYMNMSKPVLIRKITKTLKAMPKKRLAMVCYNITKAKLPRLKVTKRKALPKPKKKKEKLTKAEKNRRQKKLGALNKWRVSQGMKKIVIK